MLSNDKLLSLTETAELLHVHPNTLRIWDAQKILPAIRVGPKRVRRYRQNDLAVFLRNSREKKKIHLDEGPIIAIATMIIKDNREVLLGQRKAVRGQGEFAAPGSYLPFRESFEAAAINQVLQETGLVIKNPEVCCVTNNLKNLHQENKQSITIGMKAQYLGGIPQVLEPECCNEWKWYSINQLPKPMFEADAKIITCIKQRIFYLP
jgi:8-oxo-dGTP diphosphatase